MDNQIYTVDDTSALSFVPEETNARLISWLDYTRKHANVDSAGPADEESAYHLGAHHMLFDTLDLLNNVEGVPANKKDHTTRNLAIAFVAGGVVGSWVERKRIDRAFKRMSARIKTKLHEQTGWVNDIDKLESRDKENSR